LEACGDTHSGFHIPQAPAKPARIQERRKMKRCPQCEFIYEDDQSLCDMDGVLLVFDSRKLPNLHALATVSAPIPEKTARRNRMVPAFATLILMLAVASVYYISTMRNAAQTDYAPPSVTSTTSEAAVVTPPAPSPAEEPNQAQASASDPNQAQVPAAEPTPETTKEEPRVTHASPAPKPATAPATTPAKVSTTNRTTITKPEPKKEDSKVESILKKTGKLLKKPFKF
jgi:hypothetical protein